MDAPVKLMTRSALVDFMEGAVGIIIDWPTEVPEGYHIEVILPKLQGKVRGRQIGQEDLSRVDMDIACPSFKSQIRIHLDRMIRTGERFVTLHTTMDKKGFRARIWEHEKPEVRKGEKDH